MHTSQQRADAAALALDTIPREILIQCLCYLSDHDVLSLCLTNKAISQVATVELHRSVTFVYTPAQAIDPEFFASIIYPNHRSFQHIRQLNIEHVPFLKNDPYTFNTSVPSNRNPVSAFLMCFFDRLAPNQLLSLSLDYFVLDLPTRYFPAQQKLSRLKLPAPVSEEQRNHIISLAAVTTLEITHIQPKRVCYVEQILHSKRERLQSLRLHFQPTRHEPRGAFSNEADVNGLKSLFRALSRDDATLGFSPAPHLVNVCLDALIVHEAFDMNWGEVFDLHNLRKFEIVHPVTRILKGMTLRMSSENISNMWNLTHLRLDDVRQVESLNHALVHIGPLRKLHLNLLQPGLSPSKAAMRPHKDSLEYLWLKCRPSPKPPLNIDDIENMPTQENKYIFSPEFNIADFKKLDQLAIPFDPEMISSLPRLDSLRLLRILTRERILAKDDHAPFLIEETLLKCLMNEYFPPSRTTGQLLLMFGYGEPYRAASGWPENLFSINLLTAGPAAPRKASLQEAKLWSPRLDMLEAECEWERRFPN